MASFYFDNFSYTLGGRSKQELIMNQDDISDFYEAVKDVAPLKSPSDKVAFVKPSEPSLTQLAQREAAITTPKSASNPLTLPESIPLCDPNDISGLRKDGVQTGVYRKLRLGQYEIKRTLDLHRVSLKDAYLKVHQFLESSHQQAARCVLITHGKGKDAIIKSYTWHWLTEHPLVLAWHSAISKHGGAGATYVMLRKKREQ